MKRLCLGIRLPPEEEIVDESCTSDMDSTGDDELCGIGCSAYGVKRVAIENLKVVEFESNILVHAGGLQSVLLSCYDILGDLDHGGACCPALPRRTRGLECAV